MRKWTNQRRERREQRRLLRISDEEERGKRSRESLEKIFGEESSQEIAKASTEEKIVERIEDMARRETQFDEWEKMRKEAEKRQREDRRLNLFWRRNKCLPAQFGWNEQTPDA